MPTTAKSKIAFSIGGLTTALCSLTFVDPMRTQSYFMFLIALFVLGIFSIIGGAAGLEVKHMINNLLKRRRKDVPNR